MTKVQEVQVLLKREENLNSILINNINKNQNSECKLAKDSRSCVLYDAGAPVSCVTNGDQIKSCRPEAEGRKEMKIECHFQKAKKTLKRSIAREKAKDAAAQRASERKVKPKKSF